MEPKTPLSRIEHKNSTGIAQVDVQECSSVWTVDICSDRKWYNYGDELRSPKFSVDKYNEVDKQEFCIQLFVNGCAKSCKNSVCVRLAVVVRGGVNHEHMHLHTKLVVFNNKGDVANKICNRSLFILKSHQDERSFHKILSRNRLLDDRNGFLTNGQLKIQCSVYVQSGIVRNFCTTTASKASMIRLQEFNDFEKLLEDEKYSDTKLIVGNKEFKVHKCILAARSPVFSAMFECNMKEKIENSVEITDVEPDLMKEVLRFIYTGKVNRMENMEKDLFRVADKYDLNRLKMLCEEAITNDLTVDNIAEILIFGDFYKSKRIMEDAVDFFLANAKEIIETQNFIRTIESRAPWLSIVINRLIARF